MNNVGVAQERKKGAHLLDARHRESGVINRDKQWTAEQRLDKPEVGGSIPSPCTFMRGTDGGSGR